MTNTDIFSSNHCGSLSCHHPSPSWLLHSWPSGFLSTGWESTRGFYHETPYTIQRYYTIQVHRVAHTIQKAQPNTSLCLPIGTSQDCAREHKQRAKTNWNITSCWICWIWKLVRHFHETGLWVQLALLSNGSLNLLGSTGKRIKSNQYFHGPVIPVGPYAWCKCPSSILTQL